MSRGGRLHRLSLRCELDARNDGDAAQAAALLNYARAEAADKEGARLKSRLVQSAQKVSQGAKERGTTEREPDARAEYVAEGDLGIAW